MSDDDRQLLFGKKNRKEQQARWLALAVRPDAETRELLLSTFVCTTGNRIEDRALALGRWDPGSDIADALIEFVETAPFQSVELQPAWTRMFERLFADASAEHLDRLEAVAQGGCVVRGRSMNAWVVQMADTLVGLLRSELADVSPEADPRSADAARAAARRTIAEGNKSESLVRLVEAWRIDRSATTARLVLGMVGTAPPRPPKKHTEWMTAHEAGADIDALLVHLGRGGRHADIIERLGIAAAWPDDPRVANQLLQLLLVPPGRPTSPLGLTVIAALLRHPCRAVLAELREESIGRPELRAVATALSRRLARFPLPGAPGEHELAIAEHLGIDLSPPSDDPEQSPRFVALRELLYQEPHEHRWQQLVRLLDSWPDDEGLTVAIDYARRHLDESWPDELRRVPLSWLARLRPTGGPQWLDWQEAKSDRQWAPHEREHPALTLCRALFADQQVGFDVIPDELWHQATSLQLQSHTLEAAQTFFAKINPAAHRLEFHQYSHNATLPDDVFQRAVAIATLSFKSSRMFHDSVPLLSHSSWPVRELLIEDHWHPWGEQNLEPTAFWAGIERFSARQCNGRVRGLVGLLNAMRGLVSLRLPHGSLREGFSPALEALPTSVTELDLNGGMLQADDVATLAGLDLRLLALGLAGAALSLEDFRNLLGSDVLERVVRLALGPGSVHLATEEIGRVETLRHLSLTSELTDGGALEKLFARGLAERLETLTIEGGDLAADALVFFAHHAFPHLTELRIVNAGVTPAGCERIAGARLPSLRHLDLSGNSVRDQGARALAGAPWIDQLEHLRLDNSRINPDGICALAAVRYQRLLTLDLSNNTVKPNGAKALVEGPGLDGLVRTAVSGKHIRRPLRLVASSVNYRARAELTNRFGMGLAW